MRHVKHIQELFWDIHYLRKHSGDGTVEPFDPQRIESHLRLSNRTIIPWEYTLILEMDTIYRGVCMDKWSKK
tara:strand:- start:272 stop:487 length:216 start_codon:yes stop_codon:yes gene_type:complete